MSRSNPARDSGDDKLEEAILHLANISQRDEKFGALKLNKILFYADFASYLKRGKSITGQDYFALVDGPAPKRMKPVTDRMIASRQLAIQKVDVGMPNLMHRVLALERPKYNKLDAEDVAILDSFVAKFWDRSGTSLRNQTHKFAGWKRAFEKGEKTVIRYMSVRFDLKGFLDIELPTLPKHIIDHAKMLYRKMPDPSASA